MKQLTVSQILENRTCTLTRIDDFPKITEVFDVMFEKLLPTVKEEDQQVCANVIDFMETVVTQAYAQCELEDWKIHPIDQLKYLNDRQEMEFKIAVSVMAVYTEIFKSLVSDSLELDETERDLVELVFQFHLEKNIAVLLKMDITLAMISVNNNRISQFIATNKEDQCIVDFFKKIDALNVDVVGKIEEVLGGLDKEAAEYFEKTLVKDEETVESQIKEEQKPKKMPSEPAPTYDFVYTESSRVTPEEFTVALSNSKFSTQIPVNWDYSSVKPSNCITEMASLWMKSFINSSHKTVEDMRNMYMMFLSMSGVFGNEKFDDAVKFKVKLRNFALGQFGSELEKQFTKKIENRKKTQSKQNK